MSDRSLIGDANEVTSHPVSQATKARGHRRQQQTALRIDAEPGHEILETGYYPSEFHCPTCKLAVVGNEEELMAGTTDDGHHLIEERDPVRTRYGNE